VWLVPSGRYSGESASLATVHTETSAVSKPQWPQQSVAQFWKAPLVPFLKLCIMLPAHLVLPTNFQLYQNLATFSNLATFFLGTSSRFRPPKHLQFPNPSGLGKVLHSFGKPHESSFQRCAASQRRVPFSLSKTTKTDPQN
jgi:hypothetical protein